MYHSENTASTKGHETYTDTLLKGVGFNIRGFPRLVDPGLYLIECADGTALIGCCEEFRRHIGNDSNNYMTTPNGMPVEILCRYMDILSLAGEREHKASPEFVSRAILVTTGCSLVDYDMKRIHEKAVDLGVRVLMIADTASLKNVDACCVDHWTYDGHNLVGTTLHPGLTIDIYHEVN